MWHVWWGGTFGNVVCCFCRAHVLVCGLHVGRDVAVVLGAAGSVGVAWGRGLLMVCGIHCGRTQVSNRLHHFVTPYPRHVNRGGVHANRAYTRRWDGRSSGAFTLRRAQTTLTYFIYLECVNLITRNTDKSYSTYRGAYRGVRSTYHLTVIARANPGD